MTTFTFATIDSTWMESCIASKSEVYFESFEFCISYFRHITLSQLYFCASIRSVGSIVPPRRPLKERNYRRNSIGNYWTYVKPNEVYFLFEYYNQKVYDHLKQNKKLSFGRTLEVKIYLQVVCQQKLNVVDRVEFLPYLEFLPSHFQWYPMVRPVENNIHHFIKLFNLFIIPQG